MPRGNPGRWNSAATRNGRSEFIMQQPRVSARATSSALVKVKDIQIPVGAIEAWQRDAFLYYESIGEIAYVLNYTADTVSQCDVRVVESSRPDQKWELKETDDARALRVWNALEGPRGGKAELVRRAALHLQIAGESHLTGIPLKDEYNRPSGIIWEFLSPEELRIEGSGTNIILKRNFGGYGGMQPLELPEDTYTARLHRSDPRFTERPDSALKHVLPICKEVIMLTQVVDALAKSRISAGILFVPDEMSFGPYNETEDDSDETDEIDPFTQEIIEQLTAPVENRESAASLVPLILRGPAEYADKMHNIDVGRVMDSTYADLRQESLHRLATGMNVPIEIMQGKGGLNHWCVDEESEILTRDNGWVSQEELFVGDVVLTLNHTTGASEWQPVKDIYRAPVENYEMVSIEGDRHSSLTTPNHRWPVLHKVRENVLNPETGRKTSRVVGSERVWTTSEKLNSNDSLVVAAPCDDLPIEAKWSDAFVEVVAWAWTEGCFQQRKNGTQGTIWQSSSVNAHKVARIRSAMKGVFGDSYPRLNLNQNGAGGGAVTSDPAWCEAVRADKEGMVEFRLNFAASEVLAAAFTNINAKVVSRDFIRGLTRSQLELFIDASVAADGTILASGGCMHIAQKDPDRLAALELAATLAGYSTHIYPWMTGAPRIEMTMLSISKKTTFGLNGKKPERVSYTGLVWCPVTDNQSWVMRRHGKVSNTGNTGYNIDSDFVTKHVRPLGELITEFLTISYLRPMLIEAEDMDPEEAALYELEFDPSKIISRADASANARSAYDREEISAISYLRENGFDESDRPTRQEKKDRDLRMLMTSEPVVFGPQILPMLYPELEGQLFVPGVVPDEALDPDRTNPGDVPSISAPQRKNPTGPGATPITDQDTGQDEPTPRGPAGPRADESLIDRLATAGDSALERALEVAGSRLLSKMNGSHTDLKDRCKGMHKADIVSALSSSDMRSLKVTGADLWSGAWDSFQDKGTSWLVQHFIDAGFDSYTADRKATVVMGKLVLSMEELATSASLGPISRGSNGLRVPANIPFQALAEHERVVAGG